MLDLDPSEVPGIACRHKPVIGGDGHTAVDPPIAVGAVDRGRRKP